MGDLGFWALAQEDPDYLALVTPEGDEVKAGELLGRANQLVHALRAQGFGVGDRIATLLPNGAEMVEIYLAALQAGWYLVPINHHLVAPEIAYILKDSGAKVFVAHERFAAEAVAAAEEVGFPPAGRLAVGTIPGFASFAELKAAQPTDLPTGRTTGAVMNYTSGTTGRPKGALLTHHNLVNNGLLVGECMKLQQEDKICIPVPFYHCFGMVMGNIAAVVAGATMVFPAEHFDPLATLTAVANEKCTALYGVPTMFRAELEHPEFSKFDLSSLRTGIMAGAPCPIPLMKRVVSEMNCREITIAYGQTESSPVITQTQTDDPIEMRVNTVGRALPHTEVKIVDPITGTVVPRGVSGELWTRGYAVMKGYYNNQEATQRAIDVNRWLHTDDLAIMDGDGYCKIVGRAKDMIIRGGENIYPREIEEFLYACPSISEIQVFGIPDEMFGEEIAAFVKLKAEVATTPEEIKRFCKGKIASFKIPKHIKIVDEFPMTVTGKIQKFRMREMFVDELGLQKVSQIETA